MRGDGQLSRHPGMFISIMPSSSGHRTDKIARVRGGPFERLVGRLGSERGAFDADDFDVGHAEEAKYVSEPWDLEIGCGVLTGVDAAARAHDDHALAGD